MKGKVIQYNFYRHVDKVLEIDELAFSDLAGIIDPYPRSWWKNVKGFVFKMEDGSIAGYIVYKTKKSKLCKEKPEIFYIELVGVDPAYQGQGIGTKLVQAVLKRADSRNSICVTELLVESDKPQNIHFYEKNGFNLTTYRDVEENYEMGKYTGDYKLMIRKPHTIIQCQLNGCQNTFKFICSTCNNRYCSKECAE